jgi:hypothetical protein
MAFAHLFLIGAARQRGYAAAFFNVASPRRIEAQIPELGPYSFAAMPAGRDADW